MMAMETLRWVPRKLRQICWDRNEIEFMVMKQKKSYFIANVEIYSGYFK